VTTPLSTRSDTGRSSDNSRRDAWVGRGKPGRPGRWPRMGRRRVPYLVLGAALVLVCAAGGVLAASSLGGRETILVLARPVTVGQTLSTQDLRQASVSVDSGLGVLPASAESTVVGQTAAYSLPAGAVLSPAAVGQAQIPATGMAETAVGLKAGQYPPDLAPGAHVAVLVTPGGTNSGTGTTSSGGSTGSGSSVSSWTATVVGVAPSTQGDQATVVSLQLPQANALQVAAASATGISLVELGPGGH
jgi:hypothetical protein